MSRASKTRSLIGLVLTAGIIAAAVALYGNRAALADQIRLWNYSPPATVANLSDKIGFTDDGQRYFYMSHPAVEGKAQFNAHCGNTEVHATVLGCYTGSMIYVYDVTDPRLDGVEEVTAAHETLHAVYARLSDAERSRVDSLLQAQYDSLVGDAAFKARFSVYDSLGTADKLNELHSIFGTEVKDLSPGLEAYYATYFRDRSVVTEDYARYSGVFDNLKDRQDTLKMQIDGLSASIKQAQAAYESDVNALNGDIKTFNQRAAEGGYASQAAFARDKAALQARATALAQSRTALNAQVDDYNAKVNAYNSLSIQTRDLQNSLDSSAAPAAPSVQ